MTRDRSLTKGRSLFLALNSALRDCTREPEKIGIFGGARLVQKRCRVQKHPIFDPFYAQNPSALYGAASAKNPAPTPKILHSVCTACTDECKRVSGDRSSLNDLKNLHSVCTACTDECKRVSGVLVVVLGCTGQYWAAPDKCSQF